MNKAGLSCSISKTTAKMSYRFFKPYVGKHYEKGIHGKRVLVVGASFYCDQQACPYFKRCTDTERKDSSEFDTICPAYKAYGAPLHDEPSNAISDAPQTYQRFATYLSSKVGKREYDDAWSYVAFTNYVQFFLPSIPGRFRETRPSDLSERDYEAFNETLRELQPDIVVIWGCVFNTRVREQNKYLTDLSELERTEWYICHLQIPGVNHPIAIINPYHPSSPAWNSNITDFDHYFSNLLDEQQY